MLDFDQPVVAVPQVQRDAAAAALGLQVAVGVPGVAGDDLAADGGGFAFLRQPVVLVVAVGDALRAGRGGLALARAIADLVVAVGRGAEDVAAAVGEFFLGEAAYRVVLVVAGEGGIGRDIGELRALAVELLGLGALAIFRFNYGWDC